MVHSAHPVHGNIRLPSIQEIRRAERRALAVRFKNHDSEGREDAYLPIRFSKTFLRQTLLTLMVKFEKLEVLFWKNQFPFSGVRFI